MYVITVTGIACWTTYGVLLGQWPIIVTNSIRFGLSGFILVMKLLPHREKNTAADALDPIVGIDKKAGDADFLRQPKKRCGCNF